MSRVGEEEEHGGHSSIEAGSLAPEQSGAADILHRRTLPSPSPLVFWRNDSAEHLPIQKGLRTRIRFLGKLNQDHLSLRSGDAVTGLGGLSAGLRIISSFQNFGVVVTVGLG